MDLNEKRAELDARIAARKAAVDRRLGIVPGGGSIAAPSPCVVPASSPESPSVSVRTNRAVAPDAPERATPRGRRSGSGETILKALIAVFAIAFVLNLGWAIDRCLIHPPAPLVPTGLETLPNQIDPRVGDIPLVGSLVNEAATAASRIAAAVSEDVPAPDPPWWLFAPVAGEALMAVLLLVVLRSVRKKNGMDRDGKASEILAAFDGGLDFFGLFTIPGIVVMVVFLLLCLCVCLNVLWALCCLPYGLDRAFAWWLGDALVDAFLAWGLWWLCTHQGK